jgi:hypothetical protein
MGGSWWRWSSDFRNLFGVEARYSAWRDYSGRRGTHPHRDWPAGRGEPRGAGDGIMTGLQLLLAHAMKLALLGLLVAILARRRSRQCWTFPVFVLATLVGNSLVTIWPGVFYTSTVWMVKQSTYDLLKMAIALELAYRALRAFPGAWRTARVVILLVLGVSTVMLAVLTPRSTYRTLWEWQPSVATATVWLLTTTALLVVWYRLPIEDWPRAIMLGLAPYQLVFVTLLDLLRRWGWESRTGVGVLGSFASLALMLYWTYAAWRPAQALGRAPALDRLFRRGGGLVSVPQRG